MRDVLNVDVIGAFVCAQVAYLLIADAPFVRVARVLLSKKSSA
jgi:hypothetical protein